MQNCRLYEEPPVLIVKAGYSKHRREDVQPITRELARALAEYTKGSEPDEPVFCNMPVRDRIAKMLKKDLKAAGIPYVDAAGLFADFQAMRHTYITNLAKGGATPKEAMDLARHSDINLTMGRYSHTLVTDRAEALKALPTLTGDPGELDQQKATGTDDASVRNITSNKAGATSRATSEEQEDHNHLEDKDLDREGNRFLIRRSQVRILPGAI